MAFVRMLVSWGPVTFPVRDRFSNTLYFNVSGSIEDPNYQTLADDLRAIYATKTWCAGCKIEVRAYDMADAMPRPERAYSTITTTGAWPDTPGQLAIALSYYADRNLPRRRGRIFTGPWSPGSRNISSAIRTQLLDMGTAFSGLGGVNVDWSIYSPTTAQGGEDGHWRISDIWVDDAWDVIRSRKFPSTARSTRQING